jgi:NTF2 fold immunity protein
MCRRLGIVLMIAAISFGQTRKVKPDSVPDKVTAERIAEAVLVAQFGQERVSAQLPLRADAVKDVWLVQGLIPNSLATGGNFGVWIDKHSGCVTAMEHMK